MRHHPYVPVLTAAIFLLGTGGPARAESWTGVSLGIGGGYAVSNHAFNFSEGPAIPAGISFDLNIDAFAGEGEFMTLSAGADYQLSSKVVIGILFEYDFTNIDGEVKLSVPPLGGLSANAEMEIENQWSIGGRLGYLVTPSTLLYATAGYTRADVSDIDFSVSAGGATLNGTLADVDSFDGYFLGAGAETRLSHGFTLRAEYRYSEYDAEEITLLPDLLPAINAFVTTELQPSVQTGRISLNYRFDLGNGATADVAETSSAVSPTSWTGAYVGLGGGIGAANNVITLSEGPALPPGLFDFELDGIGHEGKFITIGAGYDVQIHPKFVAGAFIDFAHGSLEHEDTANANLGGLTIGAELKAEFEDLLMLGGRLGYLANPDTLLFVSAGYARAELSDTTISAGSNVGGGINLVLAAGEDFSGYFLGGGIETRLTSNISLRGEYRYLDLESQDITLLPDLFPQINSFVSTDFDPAIQIGRLSVTYRFSAQD